MSITVSFDSGWVNAMSLVDQRINTHFPEWPGCGNADSTHQKYFEYKNSGTAPIPFWVSQGYKQTHHDDPNKPWCKQNAISKSYTAQAITLSYRDDTTGQGRYSCLITVAITSGELPKPWEPPPAPSPAAKKTS